MFVLNGRLTQDSLTQDRLHDCTTSISYHNETSRNGRHLLDWMLRCDLVSLSNTFQKRTAKIQLSLRAYRTSKRNQQYDWSQLLTDMSVHEAYAVEVNNRFEVLQALQEEELVETTYNNLISAHQEAAAKHVPKKPKRCKRMPWEDDNVLELRQALKKSTPGHSSK